MNRIRIAIIVIALAVVMTFASSLAFGTTAEATGSCAAAAKANTPAGGAIAGTTFGEDISGFGTSGPGVLAGVVAGILTTCG